MKIVKSFVDPDNPNLEWGLNADGDVCFKYSHPYNTSIDIQDGYYHYTTEPLIPTWEYYNQHSTFGISIKTMKYIVDNFSNLIVFA
jgi:hypothetical protein